MADDSPLVNFLKVAAHLHGKEQGRYGDDGMLPGHDNEAEARMLLGPPRTSNTPGYDTDTSSRAPNSGPSRRNVVSPIEKAKAQ